MADCATPDYSDFAGGTVICKDKRQMKLGCSVSTDTPNIMEGNSIFDRIRTGVILTKRPCFLLVDVFKGVHNVDMYVRIAPLNDTAEAGAAKADCAETKQKIKNKHPDTISSKQGHNDRKAFSVPDDGDGVLKKDGKDDVPCYYCVIQYTDSHVDPTQKRGGKVLQVAK